MKTHLSPRYLLIKMGILSTLLFLTTSISFAQNRIYANNQNYQIYGPCAGCTVLHPQNAAGNNEADFSSLKVSLGLLARIEQTLIFPDSKTNYSKIAIGIGSGGTSLSVTLLGSISIETFNGNTSNNDYKTLNNSLIKLGTIPTEGTIELTVSKPYDRIKITLAGGILNLNDELRIYYAYQMPDARTYTNFQTSTQYDLAIGDGVIDPENAVGNDENNYSTLQLLRGHLGRTEQTLHFLFPVNNFLTKIIIGIGTDQPLSIDLLKKISIETMKGEVSNGDAKFITQNMLSISSQPDKGIIEFTPTKPFDRVKINMDPSNDTEQKLRVYYIYHTSPGLFNCDPPPLQPIHYYPFNNNIEDVIGGLHLTPTGNLTPILEPSNVCGNALYSTLIYWGKFYTASNENFINHPKTISFWTNLIDSSMLINAYGISVLNEENKLKVSLKMENTGDITENFQIGQYNHFTITYNEDRIKNEAKLCLYKNGYAKPNEASCIITDILNHNNPDFPIDKNLAINTPSVMSNIKFSIDEMLVYDHALSPTEVEQLFLSYNKPQIPRKLNSGNTTITNMKTLSPEERLILSPNPTTGTITFSGNIEFADAEISLVNISGKEEYRSKLQHNTLELPATLSGGVYILNLKTKENKTYSHKIILKR